MAEERKRNRDVENREAVEAGGAAGAKRKDNYTIPNEASCSPEFRRAAFLPTDFPPIGRHRKRA